MKVKGTPIALRTVGPVLIFGSEADSPQMTLVINPTVGCHYFLPGPWLPSQIKNITTLVW